MRRPQADDAALVRRANAGEPGAADALYLRHRGWVTALARRFTGSEADANDVAQETFEQLFARFPDFVLTSSMRAYLYPVVRRRSLTLLRRRRRAEALADAQEARDEGAPSRLPAAPRVLGRLLADLPAGQQEVLRLRFVLEMRLEEIAAVEGVPVGTVKSRLHNALASLRLALEVPRPAA